jgi:hypothetical protein
LSLKDATKTTDFSDGIKIYSEKRKKINDGIKNAQPGRQINSSKEL